MYDTYVKLKMLLEPLLIAHYTDPQLRPIYNNIYVIICNVADTSKEANCQQDFFVGGLRKEKKGIIKF